MRIALLKGTRSTDGEAETKPSSTLTLCEHINAVEGLEAFVVDSWADLSRLPDLHMTRFFGWKPELSAMAAYLEDAGSRAINPLQSIALMNNKHTSHLLFASYGIAQLPWQIVSEGGVLGYPSWEGETIRKPIEGFASDDIEIFSTRKKALENSRPYFMLQPFVAGAKSWRIMVGERSGVIASYYRQSEGKISAVSLGAKRIYADPGDDAKRMALLMREAVSGVLVGCDLLEVDGRFLALEINNSVGIDPENEKMFQGIIEEIS